MPQTTRKQKRLLEKHGYKVGKFLGAGAEGTVFKIKNRKKIAVKITESQQEYQLCKYLKRLKKPLRYFPKIYRIYQVGYDPDCCVDNFVIIREDIQDCPRKLYNSLQEDIDHLNSHSCDSECIQGFSDYWEDGIQFTSKQSRWFYTLHKSLWKHKIMLQDMHSENIGYRNGRIVFRDLGMCSRT